MAMSTGEFMRKYGLKKGTQKTQTQGAGGPPASGGELSTGEFMQTFNAKAAEPVHHYATMHFDEKKKQKKTQNPELPKGLSFGEYLKLGAKDAKEYLNAIGNLPRTIFDKTIDTVDNAEKGVADLGKQVTGKWDSSDIQRWAAEKEAPAQPDDKETGKGMLWKGVTQAANGFAQTLGWLPGNALKELGWENNPFSNLAEAQQQIADAAQEYYGKNMQNGTKGQKIADEIGTSTVAALPQAIMAMMTMGGSAEAQLATGGARAAATLPGIVGNAKTSAVTAQQMAQAMAKDPNFWLAFSQVAGRNYQDAKADGASDWEANAFAMANGLVNAAAEVSGGIQKLPGELQVSESALKSWIKSAAEEGQEEVVQGVLERALQNLTYNKGNKVFSTKDEDAVLNPVTGAKEFGLGMTVGGILGGGQTIVGKTAGLARGAAGNVQADVRELPKAQTVEENTQEANNSATAAQVTEVRELPMGQVSAESQVRELLGGEVTNSKAERILANAELRTAFETVTGETLAGTKAQQRETIKRAAESQNAQILQQNAQIQQAHSQNQAKIVNEPVASTANAQESGNFADVRGLPSADTQVKSKNERTSKAMPLLPERSEIAGSQGLPVRADNAVYKVVEIPQEKIDEISAYVDSVESATARKKYKRIIKDLFMGKTFKNANTLANGLYYEIGIGSKGIGEIISRQPVSADTLAMLEQLDEIVENAKWMASEPSKHTARHLKRTDIFETKAMFGELPGVARMRVNVGDQGNNLYYLTNVKTEASNSQPRNNDRWKRGIESEASASNMVSESKRDVKSTQAKESARTAAEGYARERGLLTGENTSGSAVEENARVMREAQENEARRQELRDNPVEPGTHAEKMGVKISHPFAPITNVDDLVTEAKYAKKASRDIEKKIRELNPTPAEKEFAQGIAKGASFDSAGNIVGGTYTAEQIPTTMSKEKVTQLAYYYMAKNDYAGKLIRSRKYAAQRQWQGKLEELFGTSDDRKLPGALSLQVNTMQRNVEKTFGKELGKKINEEFFDPILENSAEKIRFINRMFDRVRGFNLSESESALVQRVIEGTAVADQVSKLDPDMQKRVTDAATSTDVKKTAAEMNIPREQMELVERYKAWLDTQARLQDADVDAKKIEEAAAGYKKAYNEFYDLINEFLVSHGYDPIGYVKGYAPHMQPEKAQEGTAKFLKLIGIDAQVSELPTAIAGRTDSFRPGKQWNPYFLERTKTSNDNVEYDAVGGYESYVNYMANVLYHTDDIMKLREMSKYFRGKYARDGIGDRIAQAREMHNASLEQKIGFLESADRIAEGTRLTQEQADAALDKYIDSLFENINGMTKYGQFVSVLDDYTNKLAGKRTTGDRTIEHEVGRTALNIGNKLTKIFGESTIVGNLSSALNQTAQIPMLTAEVGVGNVAEAVRDIVTGETKADGWEGASDFLTGKRGIDQLTETKGLGKVMDVAAIPFVAVDDVASRVIVRAKYLQEVKNGATHEEAMRAADEYASRMVGNRIQGAKPMAFEGSRLSQKVLTTFQLEVANAWSHITHDLPMEYQTMAKTQGKNVAVKKFAGLAMKYLLEAFLFNRLTEWIYGGTPAPFDVIGYVTGAIGAGEGLSTNKYLLTALDNTLEAVTGERGLGTEKPDGGFDTEAAAKQLGYTVSGDIPFLSNALSAVGASDSNMPLPTIPLKTGADVAKMVVGKDADTRKEAAQKLAEDAPKELKTWLPMGNQIYKTGKGVETLVRGGAYSGYGDSERLKYPVDTSGPKGLLKGAQMVLFGPNATQDANEFYASGDRSLSVKQTQAYRDIVASGADKKTVYETMQAVRSVDDDDPEAAAKAKRDAIRNADLPDRYKQQIYSAMIGDGKDVKFSALRSEKMSWDSIMDCYDVYDRINRDDEKASVKAVEFAAEVDRMNLSDAQKTAVKSNLVFYSGVQAKAETYEKITGAGVSTSEAETLARTIGALTPEEGADSVTAMQKYKAIVDSGVSDATAAAAMQAIMPDSIAVKFSAVRQWNVPAEKYVEVYEATEGIKEKYGKTSLNAGMAKAAIDSVSGLTQEQRAALWQIQNKSWKPYKNPYSTSVGSSVRARLESGTVTNGLPTGTSRPAGALWLPR